MARPDNMQRPPPPGGMDAILAGRPNFTATQWYNPAQNAWQARRPQEQPFGNPPNPGVPPGSMPPAYGGGGGLPNNFGVGGGDQMGGMYPPGQGPFKNPLHGQTGLETVPALGNPEKAYGPPVNLSAPEILSALQKAGQAQGLSAGQIAGIAKAFQGMGGGGAPYDQLGGSGASFSISGGGNPTMTGYQGGISDIGYPPLIMPRSVFHGDKGGWQGPFDPLYTIPQY
jgi:hypothetical protein